ncbi:PH domain-containing protein [Nonomuraea sp. NPDC048882]|uniref:PH domain-containing protein n=1 Tax=Nonomuraea sp. NPDC048882 TaxID=3154347 RepID=UPI0033C27B8B
MTTTTGTRPRTAPRDHEGRLSGRLVLVSLSALLAPAALFAVSLLVTGGEPNLQILITLASFLLTGLIVGGIGLSRLATTRYRLTGDRFEVSAGLLFRSRHSIPLVRVRGIDITAHPVHRLFGLTTLHLDTGGGQGGAARRGVRLDGITEDQAAELRRLILEGSDTAHAADSDGLISELDRSWLRYAPLTVWGVGTVLAAAGTGYRTLHEMKIDPLELGVVQDLVRRFGSVPLWFGLLVTVLAVVALGAACSTLTFIENWSGYELRRGEGGVLRVRRGLLATRSVSMEEHRLRGLELVEPLPLRWAGGARLNAVTTGLGDRDENRRRRALTPAVPRPEALTIAAQILPPTGLAVWEPRDPAVRSLPAQRDLTERELLDGRELLERRGLGAHPRVALRRRVNQALTASVLIAAIPAGLGLWLGPAFVITGAITCLVLAPVLTALARSAYRSLGHAIRGPYLVTAYGAFARRTVVLRRDGVIGWSITRSPFQRRTGLLTLGATTAAGDGIYRIRDVSVDQGLTLAETALPGLLAPFIERRP